MKSLRIILLMVLLAAILPKVAMATEVSAIRNLVSDLNPQVGVPLRQCLELEYPSLPRQSANIDWPLAEGVLVTDQTPVPIRRIDYAGEPRLVESVCRQLLPLRAGTLTLPAAQISRGGRTTPANPVTLQVKPLPTAGRPADFSGAVGSVSLTLAPHQAETGEQGYELRLSGRGALELFPLPGIAPADHHLTLASDTSRRLGATEMERRLLYLAPADQSPGQPVFSLALFDPQTQSYQRLQVGNPGTPWRWLFSGLTLLALLFLALHQRRCPPRRLSPEQLLAAWAGVPLNALDRTRATNRLQQLGCDPPLVAELRRHLERRDAASFSPSTPPEAPPGEIQLGQKLRKSIDKLGQYRP